MVTRHGDGPLSVIDSFVAGDERALAEVYAHWSPLIYSVALSSLGNVSDAEEVTQRVFTAAWTSREGLDVTRAQLPAWLMGITRDQLADAQAARGEQAQPRGQGITLTRTSDAIEPSELADRLLLADEMSRLAAEPRQVVRTAFSEDLTHAQIAERMKLPAALVLTHLSRSLLTLRKRLAVLRGAH